MLKFDGKVQKYRNNFSCFWLNRYFSDLFSSGISFRLTALSKDECLHGLWSRSPRKLLYQIFEVVAILTVVKRATQEGFDTRFEKKEVKAWFLSVSKTVLERGTNGGIWTIYDWSMLQLYRHMILRIVYLFIIVYIS